MPPTVVAGSLKIAHSTRTTVRPNIHKVPPKESDNVDRTYPHHPPHHLIIFLLGGFSGRFGGYGYGYGHGGMGVIGTILVILVVLLLLGRL